MKIKVETQEAFFEHVHAFLVDITNFIQRNKNFIRYH